MLEPLEPTLAEIALVFSKLADRVVEAPDEGFCVDGYTQAQLRSALWHLELKFPGLEPTFDPDAARAMKKAAQESLRIGRNRVAFGQALHGLSFSPHDPELFHLLASAGFNVGAAELTLRLLCYVCRTNPSNEEARRDLETLSAKLDHGD